MGLVTMACLLRADTNEHRVHRIMPMRKFIWVCWCLVLLAVAASYCRSTAFDYQLTQTIWIQATTSDGNARFIVLSGDPSASPAANKIIEREKNSWRYGPSTASWSRMSLQEERVDSLGTLLRTYRVQVPLLAFLLIPPGWLLVRACLRRWKAPPRLIWAELWSTPRLGRGALGNIRRVLLLVSVVFALTAALLWVAGYLDHLPRWRYFGDHVAFVTGRNESDVRDLFDPLADGLYGLNERLAEIRDEQIDKLGRPANYFSIEIMFQGIWLRYYTADGPSGSTVPPALHAFAGFVFSRDRVEVPSVDLPFPPRLFQGMFGRSLGSGATAGVERTVILRLWVPVVLFGLWPLLCFFRGPLRRARRRAAGCCLSCGYSLAGLSEPRCPECGSQFGPEPVGWVAKRTS